MVNDTQNATQNTSSGELGEVYQALWLLGISVSLLGLLSKVALFVAIPKCRKFDEKLLFQLTLARTLNTGCEYHIMCVPFTSTVLKDIVFATYIQTDLVLVLWMFVFSKNLYNKVVLVFAVDKPRLALTAALIWTATLPFGALCPFLLKIRCFTIYYQVYAHLKLLITLVNALIFVEIFNVAIKRGSSTGRNARDLVKSSIVAFILICITSLQVLVTDILSFYYYQYKMLVNLFCVVNSYQVVAISVIFVILTQSKTKQSVFKSVSFKLREFVTP
ncbi:unnamed protein product, partial [Iphiclides podalirius]